MKIAHISDLHFGKFSFNPAQFLSKQWIGNFHLLLHRRKHYLNTRPWTLFDVFQKNGIEHVVISGDLSTTSSTEEFAMARRFVERLHALGISTSVIPGNHDHYTRRSYRTKRFYLYFPEKYDPDCPLSLKEDGITHFSLNPNWHMVLLDTALATPLYHASGLFSPSIERHLRDTFASIPREKNILLVNHFPFFKHEIPVRRLRRGDELKALLEQQDNVALYLHGHTHRHTLADLRGSKLPIVLDSGSVSHKKSGSWNLLDLTEKQCLIQVYNYSNETPLHWKSVHQKLFTCS